MFKCFMLCIFQAAGYIDQYTVIIASQQITALPLVITICKFGTVCVVCLVMALVVIYKIQKHFQNVMLVGMASEISKNYTYRCVDRSRHNGIKGAKAKCAH